MNPPQASRYPDGGQGRDGGGQVSEPGRRPGLNELEPPGETPEPGGSSQPDPVGDLIESATDWTYLLVSGVLALATILLILVVTS